MATVHADRKICVAKNETAGGDLLGRALMASSRGDWTAIELFLGGIRALTLQLSISDIEAACGRQP
jgi:hypothetical protein